MIQWHVVVSKIIYTKVQTKQTCWNKFLHASWTVLRKGNKKSKYKIIFLLNIEQNNFSHHSSTVSAGTCLQPASLATNPGSRLHPNGGCASRIIEITKRFLLYTLGGSKSLFIHRFLLYRLGGSKSWFICFGCPDLVGPSSGSYAGLCYRLGGSKSQFICTLMWWVQVMVHM